MDTQTKAGLTIAAALIATFFMGGIAFTFAGGMVRALGPMHGGAPLAASMTGAYGHTSPMMDRYGRFGDEQYSWGVECDDCEQIRPGQHGHGMRFAPQGEMPEGFGGPPWMQDGQVPPHEGECPLVQPGS